MTAENRARSSSQLTARALAVGDIVPDGDGAGDALAFIERRSGSEHLFPHAIRIGKTNYLATYMFAAQLRYTGNSDSDLSPFSRRKSRTRANSPRSSVTSKGRPVGQPPGCNRWCGRLHHTTTASVSESKTARRSLALLRAGKPPGDAGRPGMSAQPVCQAAFIFGVERRRFPHEQPADDDSLFILQGHRHEARQLRLPLLIAPRSAARPPVELHQDAAVRNARRGAQGAAQ